MAGYEPEENRKERESIAADPAPGSRTGCQGRCPGCKPGGQSASVNMSDEDGNNRCRHLYAADRLGGELRDEGRGGKPDTGETDKASSEQ